MDSEQALKNIHFICNTLLATFIIFTGYITFLSISQGRCIVIPIILTALTLSIKFTLNKIKELLTNGTPK